MFASSAESLYSTHTTYCAKVLSHHIHLHACPIHVHVHVDVDAHNHFILTAQCHYYTCSLSLSEYSSVGYLLRHVGWQQLKIIPFIPRNPARQENGVFLRKVVEESYKLSNLIQLQSMLGQPLSITMNSCGQPCGQVASLDGHEAIFPCKVLITAVHVVIIGRCARWR